MLFLLGFSGAPELLDDTCHQWGLTGNMQTQYSEAADMHHSGAAACWDLASGMHAWQTTDTFVVMYQPVGPMPNDWGPTSYFGEL